VGIFPDGRAWLVLTIAISPILLTWMVLSVKQPAIAASAVPAVAIVLALVYLGLLAKTVTVDERGLAQGWRPFATRITYTEIVRIHHMFVSTRYGSSPCLAFTARGGRKEITLPMKSFNLEKRRRLVALVVERAPEVRVDPHIASLYSQVPRNSTAS